MKAVVVLVLLATPFAAAASFLAMPAPAEQALPCGGSACVLLGPDDASVQVLQGTGYAFLAPGGGTLVAGTLEGPALLDVPEGAVLLVVHL